MDILREPDVVGKRWVYFTEASHPTDPSPQQKGRLENKTDQSYNSTPQPKAKRKIERLSQSW